MAEAQAAGAHAQAALAEAESEDVGLQEGLAVLEDRSSRMLQREMQALDVMNTLRDGQEVGLGDSEFVWSSLPVTDSIDWSAIF